MASGGRRVGRGLDELQHEAELGHRVEVGEAAVAVASVAAAGLQHPVAAALQLADGGGEVADAHAEVVQALAALGEPLVVQAGPAERLDELDLRIGPGEREAHREAARRAAEAALGHDIRAVGPDLPGPARERGGVARDRRVEVAHDDADLVDAEAAAEQRHATAPPGAPRAAGAAPAPSLAERAVDRRHRALQVLVAVLGRDEPRARARAR